MASDAFSGSKYDQQVVININFLILYLFIIMSLIEVIEVFEVDLWTQKVPLLKMNKSF